MGGVTGEDVHVYVAAALPVRRLLSLRSFIIFFSSLSLTLSVLFPLGVHRFGWTGSPVAWICFRFPSPCCPRARPDRSLVLARARGVAIRVGGWVSGWDG